MGVGYSTAIDVIEREFVKVQQLDDNKAEGARRNILYDELVQFNLPESLRVDLRHIAVLFVMDANKDGVFSYDDLVSFAMWVASTLPQDVTSTEFSDAVQARCVLKMWKECCEAAGINAGKIDGQSSSSTTDKFVDWLCCFLRRNYQSPDEVAPVRRQLSPVHDPNAPPPEPSSDDAPQIGAGNDEEEALPGMPSGFTLAQPPTLSARERANPTRSSDGDGGGGAPSPIVGSPRHDGEEQYYDDEDDPLGDSDESIAELLRPVRAPEEDDAKMRKAETFNLKSLQAVYNLLNVKDGYGLGFHTFCNVLHPDRAIAPNMATPSLTLTGSINFDPNMANITVDDPDFTVTGASLRAFLDAFTTSYWGILRKLGLDVLLGE